MSMTIQDILETRQDELCRLLEKTSSRITSQEHTKKFLKPTIVIKMLRIEQTTTTKGCARSMIFDRSSIYAKDGG
jgi:hypothetical protein